MSKSKNNKRGPKPNKRNAVILQLRECKRATAAQMNASAAFCFQIQQAGYVTRAGIEEKSGRGRKRIIWRLTPRGQAVATNLLKQSKRIAA